MSRTAKVHPGCADDIAPDDEGNIWSSAADGIHCIAPDGREPGRVRIPFRVSNLRFGGSPHLNHLFIGDSHTLFAVFLNRRGACRPSAKSFLSHLAAGETGPIEKSPDVPRVND